MQGLNKTKAALQGRQCNYKKLKPSQITTLIDQVNSGHKLTAPLAQLIRDTRKSAHTGNSTDLKSLAAWWVSPNLDRPQPIDISDFPQWGEYTPMADTLRKSNLAEGESPPSKQNHGVIVQPFGSSLAFLRWRRLISPLAAVTRNPAVLSPSTFSCSISSITSCGIRTVVICDFAFFAPVAITGSPYIRCMSVYAEIIIKKGLKCISLMCSVKNIGEIHLEMARPGSVGALTGPLTTNDRLRIEVAMKNHITPISGRTAYTLNTARSKFTWLFIGTPTNTPNCTPIVLRTEADTETEARELFPAWSLTFAAKIRTECSVTDHRSGVVVFDLMEVRHA
ncbi:host cell division inhibitor Icd-like protein [Yersinia enterocolitica]|nr:host cell division inhibitor Icd-like protein [Yersinia enterocolitica]